MSNILDTIYRVAHNYPGGVNALAARMGQSKWVLQNKINPNCDTHFVRAEEAAQIADLADSDEIAKAYAARRGLICVHGPQYDGLSDQALLDLFLEMEKQKGEWAYECKQALEDGRIDAREFERIQKEYQEFVTASAEVMSRLESIVQASKK